MNPDYLTRTVREDHYIVFDGVRYDVPLSFEVRRDEVLRGLFPTDNEAWMSLHRFQGQSAHYATEWGGWLIHEVDDADVEYEVHDGPTIHEHETARLIDESGITPGGSE